MGGVIRLPKSHLSRCHIDYQSVKKKIFMLINGIIVYIDSVKPLMNIAKNYESKDIKLLDI